MPRTSKPKVVIGDEPIDVGGDLKTTIRKTKNTLKKVGRVAKVIAPIVVNPVAGIAMASTQLKKRKAGVLPPLVRNLLKEIGNQEIISIKIVRTPLEAPIQGLLNIVSLGTFQKAVKDSSYDSMFHLALFLNNEIQLDKQAVITMMRNNPIKSNSEVYEVAIGADQKITFQTLLDKTRTLMGDSAFTNYNARTNNCQDFVMAILKANDLNSPQAQTFVKQDAEAIFTKMPKFTDKVAKFFTDVGAVADELLEGEGYAEEWVQIGKDHYHFPLSVKRTKATQGGDVDQEKFQEAKRDEKIRDLYGEQVLKAVDQIEKNPIPNLPQRFHVGEYYAQRDPQKSFYTVHHQITSRIIGDQLSYEAAKALMENLDKKTIKIQEQNMAEIVRKENLIKKKLIQKPKKEKVAKPKKEKKSLYKTNMQTWRQFWAESCKGKKFGSRQAVNDYMKEMAKKYKEMKAKQGK